MPALWEVSFKKKKSDLSFCIGIFHIRIGLCLFQVNAKICNCISFSCFCHSTRLWFNWSKVLLSLCFSEGKKKKESITCIGLENTLKKSVCGWQKDRLCLLLWDLFYLFKVLDLLVKLVASVEVLPFGALRFDFAEKFDDLCRWPQFQYEIQWLRLSRLGSELLQLVLKASAVLNRTGAKTKKVFGGS